MEARIPIVRVTAKDCRWDYFKASGAGGQKRNKTSSAVRCTHDPSGAVGTASDTRSQSKNRELAFYRMASSDEFNKWLRLEVARQTGEQERIEKRVETQMQPENLKVEGRVNGKWKPLEIDHDGSSS